MQHDEELDLEILRDLVKEWRRKTQVYREESKHPRDYEAGKAEVFRFCANELNKKADLRL